MTSAVNSGLNNLNLADKIPISAEDGRNGVFVLVSAVSVLSGVAPPLNWIIILFFEKKYVLVFSIFFQLFHIFGLTNKL